MSPRFEGIASVLPQDEALRGLRDPEAFDAAARATPWVAEGRAIPISGVRTITFPPNSVRALALGAAPAGLLPVGDAACLTDPVFGRGMSLALAHAFQLARLLRAHPQAGPELSRAAASAAERLFLPWYDHAREEGRDRIARWRAALAEEPALTVSPSPLRRAAAVANRDPTIWRGVTRVLMGLSTPAEVFTDEAFEARVRRALALGSPSLPPGLPSRAELLAITRPKGSENASAGSVPG